MITYTDAAKMLGFKKISNLDYWIKRLDIVVRKDWQGNRCLEFDSVVSIGVGLKYRELTEGCHLPSHFKIAPSSFAGNEIMSSYCAILDFNTTWFKSWDEVKDICNKALGGRYLNTLVIIDVSKVIDEISSRIDRN